jgi:formylglycine-generating enzyme required for sulfatase activity
MTSLPRKIDVQIVVLTSVLAAATVAHVFARGTVAEVSQAQTPAKGVSAPTARTLKKNSRDGLIYVWVPAGSFMMGCSPGDDQCFNEEKPEHQVSISKGFWIGQAEVTVEAYKRFAGIAEDRKLAPGNASSGARSAGRQDDGKDMPIVNVTWDEASNYCKWIGGRLPTEAEWEYAARAGSTTSRYGELDDIAWYEKNSGNTIHPVGQKQANQFGLFDMLGNSWEWVNDWYDGKYYLSSPESDPPGPENGQMHGLRGGSWLNGAKLVRVSDRGRSTPELRFNYFGLRCVLVADGL